MISTPSLVICGLATTSAIHLALTPRSDSGEQTLEILADLVMSAALVIGAELLSGHGYPLGSWLLTLPSLATLLVACYFAVAVSIKAKRSMERINRRRKNSTPTQPL